MNGLARRMVTIPRIIIVTVVLAAIAAALVPVSFPGPDHGLAIQAPGSSGSLGSPASWWDPRGWFGGGGDAAPTSHAIAAYKPAAGRPPGHIAGQDPHKSAHRVRQMPARDGYTRLYQMSDGTEQAVVSAGPVNYQAPSGAWAPISTAVRPSRQPGYSLQNTTNAFQSFFGSAAEQLVRFNAPGGGWVTIGVSGARSLRPAARGDTVTYAGIAAGVSLSYEVTPQSLTEKIILASPAAASALAALRFTVRTGGGLTPVAQRDGSIALARDGVPVLTLPKPFMTDATPSASSPYGYAWSPLVGQHAAVNAKAGTVTLSLSADAGWLGQSGRRFPVVVDPTIDISPTPATAQNVMIEQDTPATNYSTIWRLSVGTTPAGAVRSLLSFPLGAVPGNTALTSATLKLYYDQNFGPGTANQTVQADQAKAAWSASTATWSNASNNVGTAGPSVTVNPNAANIWDSFTVTSIVQSWLTGASPNYGFVVKPANESALNVGGPRYEASFNGYNGEVVTYPQLVLTYGTPGVTPSPITTIHATGAELSWSAYANSTGNTGKDLASYQVYRSVFQSFTPSASTLIATVPATKTSFTDTTNTPTPPGGLGNAFYYMIAVKTKDGTVIPGPVQLVRLPTAGSTVKIVNATAATSLSSTQPTTVEQHITGQPWTSVGDDSATFGTTRSIYAFPSMASAGIPSDATVSEAHLKLWGFYNDTSGGATYDAYELTQSFTASQATWNSAATGTAWTTAGGTYNSSVLSQVTGLTNDPERHNWAVTAAVRDWIATPANEHGLIVKLDSSAVAERELFTDTTAAEPALRPELVVTYTEPVPEDTYYAPSLPDLMSSSTSYTVPVTLTNTTAATWAVSDWVLSYHWLAPDGTDLSTSANQVQTALPASMAPSSVATVNATIKTPDTSSSGDARAGYQLAWDLFDKTTGTWLSSGTSTPVLTTASATRLGGAATASRTATVVPMAQGNNTVATLKQAASVEQPSSDLLGLEKFYQYTGISTGAGSSIQNNADAGNVVWNYNAFSNPSRGFQTFVRLSYNSMDTTESSMGFGWSLQASSLMRLGTPLDFLPNPPQNATTVKLTDGDGTSHLFTLNSSTGQWLSPPGVHYYLQNVSASGCSANGKDPVARAWLLTAPDRTQFWFDCQGYQTAVIDNNGNEADFSYTQRNSNNQPREFLDYITDPTGRQTLTVSYYAKGDTYSYIDANGNVASGTNLTNPDIIDMVKSLTDVSGRTITFLYNMQGEMARMTDGDGTPVAKVFKFGYDPTQGNKNVKLVSVTDPRGDTTSLAYYTAPQDPKFKWSLESVSDRLNRTTNFAYTEETGGGMQAVVTDPKGNTSTYLLDATGRPVQVTDAKNQTSTIGWDSDNNVTSLTQPNGAQTTWTYDPNTGYPLTTKGAQANHDGTAGTTYAYQTALNGHIADLTSELTPQQRLWTFTYDAKGNLASTTMPDGNVSGAAAGSFTSTYTYDSFGDLLTSTDPNGNVAKYGPDYDPTGSPLSATDPLGNTATYVYDVRGNVLSQTDPSQHTSTYTYDVFGRPTGSKVPEDQANGVYITTPAPVYDGNDNMLQSTAPNGAVTTTAYDADDEATSQTLPPDSGSSSAPARTDTFSYDADGNLLTATQPNGNVPGAAPGSFTTTYGYDAINEQTQVTDALGHKTAYGYDNVGNTTSVTDAQGNTLSYAYNLNNWPTQTTDASGHTKSTGYDLDGNITSQTDENGATTLYTIDPDGLMTQQEVPYTTSGGTTTYHITQYVYDQDGNQTEVITPRGVASGVTGAFTAVTKYNADNQVKAQLGAYDPSDPVYNTPAETDYTYWPTGQVKTVTAPPSGGGGGPNVTSYNYFDNGWAKDATNPWNVKTSYTYDPLGDQTSQSLSAAGGRLTRGNSWSYYPNGSLASRTDAGIPTGLNVEEVDNSDFNNAVPNPAAGAWVSQPGGTQNEGYDYQTHTAGTANDTFSWHLSIPADGTYAVYVKYPAVQNAAANAQYTVNYDDGTGTGTTATATATVDQTQNAGNWVKLGSWAFSQSNAKQQVTLAENSSGTVTADAVLVVRDNSGDTNTQNETFSYSYDPAGNLTGITASGPSVTSSGYTVSYDQVSQVTGVTQQDASGNTTHTTAFGYDPVGDLTSQVNDGQTSTYGYDARGLLSTVSVPKSNTDSTPQTTTYTYTPTGLLATEAKPNGNTVSYGYYLDGHQQSQSEVKSDGTTLVSSHAYSYDQDGNQTQDVQKLMSADGTGGYLSHTLNYTYNPSDQVTQVNKDGAVNQKYGYDLDGNITSQLVNGASTVFGYDRSRLLTATTNGVTSDYNYDPLGRLDSITTDGALGSQYTYDGFDHVTAVRQYATGGSSSTTAYAYDPLDRQTSQTTNAGTGSAKRTDYEYLGMSNELIQESSGGTVTKSYGYSPWGERLSQNTYNSDGTSSNGYYSYDSHSNVQAVTGSSGDTTATYGYTAYGQDDTSQFTGADKPGTQQPGAQPYNPYRFNADRSDGPGGYNMGFRDYSPDTGRFLTPDGYDGALANQGLVTDPFTGSPYGYGDGNPLSNIELDGHGFWSDLGHAALSVAGMVPVVGAAADAANAVWYAADGDYGDAALSAAGAIPVIGDAILGGRLAVTGAKLTEDGVEGAEDGLKAYRAAKGAANTAEAANDAAKIGDDAANIENDVMDLKRLEAQTQRQLEEQAIQKQAKALAQKQADEAAAAARKAAADNEAQQVAEESAPTSGTSVFRTARLGKGQSELDNGLDPANFRTGNQSAYVGDESAARTLANPKVGGYENFYTRFDMHPDFEAEFAKYKFRYPEGGPNSYEYEIPQNLIERFNQLTINRTRVPF